MLLSEIGDDDVVGNARALEFYTLFSGRWQLHLPARQRIVRLVGARETQRIIAAPWHRETVVVGDISSI